MNHLARLSVNVDHAATVREARKAAEPDPAAAAMLAELAGAHGITCHLRGDRRHVQERDLEILRRTVKTQLNVEMAATEEMVKIASALQPDLVTFVPERPQEVTTEGGLDVMLHGEAIRSFAQILHGSRVAVSLFVDPDADQIKAANRLEADMVELNTTRYAEAASEEAAGKELETLRDAVRMAMKFGLRVAAGHGLDYRNVRPVAAMEGVEELNIGHSIVARAVLVGMERAVRDMLAAMRGA
jgi:pyridoxine 5-phosphate synthase